MLVARTLTWTSACMMLASAALAVPPRPDVVERLETQGQWAGIAATHRSLREAGWNTPSARTRATAHRAATGGGLTIPVLLVDFADHTAAAGGSQGRPHYEELLFSQNSHPTGSMREYYLENSYGRFDLTGQVSGWHRMPESYAYYVNDQAGTGSYPRNARRLAEDAVRAADLADPSLDFSQFDLTGPGGEPDGVIDGLIVVHAGRGFELSGDRGDLHSHFWTVVDTDVVVDGVRVVSYVTCPQDGRVGVFAHEFGHQLGLPDLYDTSGAGSSGTHTGVGIWSIMGFGSWLDQNGTVLGTRSGEMPSHFSAWAKLQLGFAEAIELTSNQLGAELPRVEEAPAIYRLWTHGRASRQYFLIENRARIGFDRGLPFSSATLGGLLVWHVDDDQPTNNNPARMLLQLEQADGRRDIETNANQGEAGDAFGQFGEFGADTSPSSRDYDGADTQVGFANITANLSTGAYTADLIVETQPSIFAADLVVQDGNGNADGGLDSGESATVDLVVQNEGVDATGVVVELLSADPAVTITGGAQSVGELAADQSQVVPGAFQVTVGTLPTDPYPVELRLRSTATGGYQEERPLTLAAGDVVGLNAEVSSTTDPAGFTHTAGRDGYHDDWHLSRRRAHSGGVSWRCAPPDADTYRDRTDGLLTTPVFALDGVSRLFFWQFIDAETEAATRAWDGGLVEVSIAGQAWQGIEPTGGYPYQVNRNQHSPISGRGAFSGTQEWHRVEFDLRGLSGAAQLRFRFGSDGSVRQEGWYVDDILILSEAEPYLITLLRPVASAGGEVTVAWEVDELFQVPYDGQGFHVLRRRVSADFALGARAQTDFVQLTESPLSPEQTFVDRSTQPAETYEYLLEDLRRPGMSPRLHGPERVSIGSIAPAPHWVRVMPNPLRRTSERMRLQFVLPQAPGGGDVATRVSLYNTSGRLVRQLVDRPLPPGKTELVWDGRLWNGVEARSGVYYAQIVAAGRSAVQRLTVVR